MGFAARAISRTGLLFALSWRNLWRHRRRNGIMLVAIALAVTGVVLLNALMRGMQVQMAEAVIENLTGHVKVLHPGYLDDPGIERSFNVESITSDIKVLHPGYLDDPGIERSFNVESITSDIGVLQPGYLDDPGIERGFDVSARWTERLDAELLEGWTSRIRVPAVIMSERETRGVQLIGIRPGQENISFLADVEYRGENLGDASDRRVVIGKVLAEQLETEIGRRLVLVTLGADGLNREAGYRIAGTFDADGEGLEKAFVFTGEDALKDLLDTDAVTEISFRLKDGVAAETLLPTLEDVFATLDVLTWQELEPQAAAMVTFADTGIYVYFFVFMGALAFGLVNALVTAVMERLREIGMLRALGMRPFTVVLQVVIECTLIMLLGVLAGLVLGYAIFLTVSDGIDLSAFSESMELMGVRSLFIPVMRYDDIMLVVGMSLVLGVVASFYPARRAVKLKPLDAMRR